MAKTILLLTKQDRFSDEAAAVAKSILGEKVEHFSGSFGDPMPARLEQGADLLLSFLSPWIVPRRVLAICGTAINFHPGSTEYPGIGCYNFALYDEAAEFGAVCHHMLPKVDTGLIVEERRFPTFPSDTVEILKLRTMITMQAMFHDIVCGIAKGAPLPVAETHWTRAPYTRRQLNGLTELSPSMAQGEIDRRVRAATYPGFPGLVMSTPGGTIVYPVPDRAPIA